MECIIFIEKVSHLHRRSNGFGVALYTKLLGRRPKQVHETMSNSLLGLGCVTFSIVLSYARINFFFFC